MASAIQKTAKNRMQSKSPSKLQKSIKNIEKVICKKKSKSKRKKLKKSESKNRSPKTNPSIKKPSINKIPKQEMQKQIKNMEGKTGTKGNV